MVLDPIFSFSRGILRILAPVAAAFSWNPRDLRSQAEKMLLEHGDPGSCLDKLWELADPVSWTIIMSLYLS